MTKHQRNLALGLAFLAPNIIGVLLFTVLPLIFSIILAFSNWDLRLHNMFKDEPLQFVGLDNFIRLFNEGDFYSFFGNTLFFMIGIPFGMAGSLMAAILLSKDMGQRSTKSIAWGLMTLVMISSCILLTMLGMGSSAMAILFTGIVALVAMAGYGGGQTVYRTFFYTPHFTAGVATFILWKKLYNPNSGAINNILNPILGTFSNAVQATPSPWLVALSWCSALLGAGILFKCLLKHLRAWLDADIGFVSLTLLVSIALLPVMVGYIWQQGTSFQTLYLALMACGMGSLACITSLRKPLEQTHKTKGMDHRVIIQIIWMVLHFAIIGLTAILFQLETMASDGLEAPMWLVDYYWAKPALMLMGLWGAIGSNNMLLYLAALTNIPQDLYEAAEIDGANTVDTFWNVTWPQLAPTTFFIFIMSLIYGLQGGMEMAKTMTEGGPAGATTTLSYFIYMEGFETGRLGYASAISWALFLLVFTVTMVNWKFGGKK